MINSQDEPGIGQPSPPSNIPFQSSQGPSPISSEGLRCIAAALWPRCRPLGRVAAGRLLRALSQLRGAALSGRLHPWPGCRLLVRAACRRCRCYLSRLRRAAPSDYRRTGPWCSLRGRAANGRWPHSRSGPPCVAPSVHPQHCSRCRLLGRAAAGRQPHGRSRLQHAAPSVCSNVQDPHVGHDNIPDTLPGQTIY